MVCKNGGIYGFLGPSWVLITMAPRNSNNIPVSYFSNAKRGPIVAQRAEIFVFVCPIWQFLESKKERKKGGVDLQLSIVSRSAAESRRPQN